MSNLRTSMLGQKITCPLTGLQNVPKLSNLLGNLVQRTGHPNYLTQTSDNYTKGLNSALDSLHKFRLTCYCYDIKDSLIQYKHSLVDGFNPVTLQLRHLMRDHEYRFEFLCDVVKYDKFVDYYESWFQLCTENLNSFYLFCFQPDSIHSNNIVRHSTIYAKPENNNISVLLKSITVNGYCILSNLKDVEMINGFYGYNESFYIDKMSGKKRSTHSFSYLPKGENKIILPITTGAISDTLSLKVRRVILNKIDSTYIYIKNPDNKCFVSEIDCKSLKQESCIYY